MKKHMRFAALLAGTLTFITACPTAYAADKLYYFGIEGSETFEEMQILDDKGALQYGVLNAFYGSVNEDTPYYLCTYHLDKDYIRNYVDSETGEVKQETYHVTGDPMYLVVPRSNVIRFVFRNGLAPDAAVDQATAIIQKYFPDTEPYYGLTTNVYEICVEDEIARTTESSVNLMHDLAEAGLISAFYSWGETANYLEVEHGYLTAYNPNKRRWSDQEYDWSAIEAWVKAEHPDCQFVNTMDKESDLTPQLGIGYAVIPPEGTAIPEHFALAIELYEKFGLMPNAYPTPFETRNSPMTGHNALAVSGDVTLDCSIDVSDAVLLARFCTEDSTAVITDQGKQNADVNGSGNVDLDDVTAILRKIARLD